MNATMSHNSINMNRNNFSICKYIPHFFNYLNLLICIILIFSCSGSQQDVLDGEFLPPEARTFIIAADSRIITGEYFYATVFASNIAGGNLITAYDGSLTWSIVGNGSLTVVNGDGWINGQQTFTLVYNNTDLLPGHNEVIALSALDNEDKKFRGLSNNIVAEGPIQNDYFVISSPTSVTAGVDFNITITAIGTDGRIFDDYMGSVDLRIAGSSTSAITPSYLGPFTNGELNATVQFSDAAPSITIIATDASDSNVTGSSVPINAGFNELGLTGISTETNRIRLGWQPVENAYKFFIYQKQSGVWIKIGDTLSDVTSYTVEDSNITGAQVLPGTEYNFRVDVKNDDLDVIVSSGVTVTAITSTCTTTISSSSITDTTWSLSGSPYCLDNSTITIDSDLTVEDSVVVRVLSEKYNNIFRGKHDC